MQRDLREAARALRAEQALLEAHLALDEGALVQCNAMATALAELEPTSGCAVHLARLEALDGAGADRWRARTERAAATEATLSAIAARRAQLRMRLNALSPGLDVAPLPQLAGFLEEPCPDEREGFLEEPEEGGQLARLTDGRVRRGLGWQAALAAAAVGFFLAALAGGARRGRSKRVTAVAVEREEPAAAVERDVAVAEPVPAAVPEAEGRGEVRGGRALSVEELEQLGFVRVPTRARHAMFAAPPVELLLAEVAHGDVL